MSPSVTAVTVHTESTGTVAIGATTTDVGITVGITGGNVVGTAVVGGVDIVEVDGIAVLTTTVVDDCAAGADVSAADTSGAGSEVRSATAAPPPGPFPSAWAPTTPTPVTTIPAHAQNGTRRQRRFHNGTRAGGRSGSGKARPLKGDRQCSNGCA
ncbi:MAG TPA: hypothetical protein VFV63_03665 [Ilumatobacteraceae bacterium]|nr:hypothetical protein [Ilumatobacteraceae bacterium]